MSIPDDRKPPALDPGVFALDLRAVAQGIRDSIQGELATLRTTVGALDQWITDQDLLTVPRQLRLLREVYDADDPGKVTFCREADWRIWACRNAQRCQAADCLQRPLRSRFRQRLSGSVGQISERSQDVEKPIRIASVQFHEFKAFARYSLSLDHVNILVGPNNSGKSTILGAFRTLAIGLRQARSKKPECVDTPEGSGPGYRLSETTLPMSLENVHTNYGATDSRVIFQLSNGNRLHLMFPRTEGCFLIPETRSTFIQSPASFKKAFPIDLTVVPVLGPLEHRERRRERETVVAGLSTHRASRHFRSYWHYFPDGFEDFAALIRTTWPGMDIQPPEIADLFTGELSMFCLEDRLTRELCWAGFGFQIWCQLLNSRSESEGRDTFGRRRTRGVFASRRPKTATRHSP